MQSDANVATQSPVDLVHLRRFTMGDVGLEQEILGLFAEHAPTTLTQLAQAKTEKEWQAAAHSLKGSARAVGAHAVADLAAEAERAFPELDTAKQQQLAAVAGAIDAARDYIAHLTGAFAPGQA